MNIEMSRSKRMLQLIILKYLCCVASLAREAVSWYLRRKSPPPVISGYNIETSYRVRSCFDSTTSKDQRLDFK